jgi:hypothetical protein
MKTLAGLTLSLFLISGPALAETPKDADSKAPEPANAAKPKAGKKAEKSNAEFAAELDELRQALQSQQEQLQLLKEELAKRDRQIEEARESAAAANARATEASSKAAEASTKAIEASNSNAEMKTEAASLNTTVSALKTSNEALATAAAKAQADAQKAEETGPASIKYKGVTITPGGFLEFAGVYRTRATSADINTPLTSIPYPGNSLAKVSEINFTGRHSRFTLLGEGNVGDVKATAYYEIDWLGACVTSNNRQSNSYCQRQRQIWGQAAWHGFSVTGGQMWTLATEDRKGINNRQEIQPLVIDPQYHVGYTWARQPSIRIVKEFGKVALGLSLENAQATLGGRGFTSYQNTSASGAVTASQNFFLNAPGASGGLYNAFDATGYTPNKTPDVIFKAALDPGYGHYEVFGIVSTFRNRVYPCAVVSPNPSATVIYAATSLPQVTCNGEAAGAATIQTPSAVGGFTDSKVGGGGGASLRIPLGGKKVEFTVQGAAGDGIGRYGSAQIADETFRPDGTAALIRTAHGLGGLELHPNAKLDAYFYGGTEYGWRAAYNGYTTVRITNSPAVPAQGGNPAYVSIATVNVTSTIGGYGSPAANNSGCSTETAPTGSFTPGTGGTCAGDIRAITQGTVGFWFKPYQGPKGGFRWGVQYSYLTKGGWSGAGGISPKAVDNMVLTSFRYYIP